MKFLNQVKRQTPESVELEFTLAGIGNRAYALFIDYVILWLGGVLLFFLAVFLILNPLTEVLTGLVGTDSIEMWLFAVFTLLSFAVYMGYFVGFEAYFQGQTPGKALAKIRVIQEDGRPLTIFQAMLRSLMRPVDDFLFLGFFLIIFNRQEKRLGDLLGGTLVVQDQAPTVSQKLTLSEAAKPIAQILLNRADFNQLLPDDFAVIREYLQRRSRMNANAKKDLSLRLAKEIQAIIQLTELPEDMSADTFLEAVYLGYQATQNTGS